jgi:glycosyltransferase involved in cell wall biosynthesis
MRIGIASPFELQMLLEYLYEDDKKNMKNIEGLTGTQPTQIAIQFIKKDYNISIFTLSQDIELNEYKVFKGKNLTIYVGHFRRGKKVTLDFQRKEVMLVKKMILLENPDVLSCHWTYEFALAGILSKIPTLITVRDWSPAILMLMKKPYRFMRMIMSFFVYLKGNNFIPNSPYIENKLKFLNTKRLDIIPNGIDDSLLLTNKKIFNKSLNLISINNGFGERKNLKQLLIAFNKIVKNNYKIKLFLLGDGFALDDEAYLWCKENKYLENIEFIGKVNYNEVIQYIDNSDLMVHPSKEESFGNILVEAMARRVPVIAGKESGAVPWVIKESGILVDINKSDEIYKAILKFIETPKLLEIYSLKGYDNVFNRFRMSEIELQYLNNFHKIIGDR